jgi:antitoxin component of MazEF toxin-antitoxin module
VIIAQVELGDEVEIEVQHAPLVIRPTARPRYGWEDQFKAMTQRGDDLLLD